MLIRGIDVRCLGFFRQDFGTQINAFVTNILFYPLTGGNLDDCCSMASLRQAISVFSVGFFAAKRALPIRCERPAFRGRIRMYCNAKVDAFVADMDRGTGDDFVHLINRTVAEGTSHATLTFGLGLFDRLAEPFLSKALRTT